jgi:hypothetical protein
VSALLASEFIAALDLETRLDSWGYVLRVRRGIHTCDSVEGWYRSPRMKAAFREPPPAKVILGAQDADEIERAVCTLDLYRHLLLKFWYVTMYSEGECLRRAAKECDIQRRHARDWPAIMGMCRALVAVALDHPAVIRKDRAQRIAEAALWKDYR